jgi:hypothetical protein
VLGKIFERIKETVESIKNLFPKNVETLDEFVALAAENENLVEIEPLCETQTSQNGFGDPLCSTVVIGHKYFVRLVSKTKKGKYIIYEKLCGFLSVISKVGEDQNLIKETRSQAGEILKSIKAMNPKVSAKIVEA